MKAVGKKKKKQKKLSHLPLLTSVNTKVLFKNAYFYVRSFTLFLQYMRRRKKAGPSLMSPKRKENIENQKKPSDIKV